ncbi:MAG: nucleotidyl transferase AbiEii/AbiGii toxin family protein [Bacteriovoracaceae bacterium]
MSKAIEQSVKEKLKNIAKKEGVAFQILLETLFLERFMVRLAASNYHKNFIFKGGMCLDQYLEMGRETRDLDFLMYKIESNADKVQKIFEEVASIKMNDGFEFIDIKLDLLSIEHKKYPGYRMGVTGKLGQIKQLITVDVGVGDVVRPKLIEVELLQDQGPIFETSIKVSAYPPEYIFAEKFEAIIHLGESNGRMKDFYDCMQIIQEASISKEEFKEAIEATFSNRGTKVGLIPDHAVKLALRWSGFVRKNKISNVEIGEVILIINEFLQKIGIKDE